MTQLLHWRVLCVRARVSECSSTESARYHPLNLYSARLLPFYLHRHRLMFVFRRSLQCLTFNKTSPGQILFSLMQFYANYAGVKVVKSYQTFVGKKWGGLLMENLDFLRLFGLTLSCIWP